MFDATNAAHVDRRNVLSVTNKILLDRVVGKMRVLDKSSAVDPMKYAIAMNT
jgi:hypothetical protein